MEVADPAAAEHLHQAFDLNGGAHVQESEAPTTDFRGFSLSLIASQSANVDCLIEKALDAPGRSVTPECCFATLVQSCYLVRGGFERRGKQTAIPMSTRLWAGSDCRVAF